MNDLCDDFNQLNCGIHVQYTHVSPFLNADGIVLITETAGDLQDILNVVFIQCDRLHLDEDNAKCK